MGGCGAGCSFVEPESVWSSGIFGRLCASSVMVCRPMSCRARDAAGFSGAMMDR